MRVLHINSYFNGCPFYQHLFAAQAAQGEQVRVFVPMAKGDPGAAASYYGPWSDVSEDHGRYDRAVFQVKHAKILRDARARYGAGGFDIVHAHSLFSNGYIAMKLARQLGVPYIVAVRDTDVNVFFRRMPHLRGLGRRILSGASRVVFLSEPYRQTALLPYLSASEFAQVMAKSAVIPNGIDPWWHAHAGEPHVLGAGPVRLLAVGRVSRRKNITAAIEAAKLLAVRGTAVQFTVVTGKVEDETMLREIERAPFVTLHKNLTREQLLPHYRGADLFVVPSLTETFGLVYAEAMSQGLPVIYTRGQGFDGQFPDGEVGFAVDPLDVPGIAQAMERILADYRRTSERCIRLSKKFDWTDFVRQYGEMYREVTGKG